VVWGENDAFITLENDDMLTTRLVAGADGANSWLRPIMTKWPCVLL